VIFVEIPFDDLILKYFDSFFESFINKHMTDRCNPTGIFRKMRASSNIPMMPFMVELIKFENA
jgi:hypothetical protein